MGQEAAAVATTAVVCIMTWTGTAADAASSGVTVLAPHSASTYPSWSSRAWDVYQRYYRETTLATENANKGGGRWGRLLGLIADDRFQKKDDVVSTSKVGDVCHSPFGIDDEDRIATCFGEDSVVMASYLSDVKFATSILSTLNALGGDDLPLFDGDVSQYGLFEFTVHHHYDEAATAATLANDNLSVPEEDAIIVNGSIQTSATDPLSGPPDTSSNASDASAQSLNETDIEAPISTSESAQSTTNRSSSSINDDSNATVTAPQNTSDTSLDNVDGDQILLTMLKCIGSSSDDVHGFVSSSLSQPDDLQEDSLGNLCSVCMQEVQEMLAADNGASASGSLANTYAGGSSNAYFQLYCTDASGREGGKSKLLLTAGGGHDGQAGPNDTYGSGGGAGMQVQAQPLKGSEFVFDTFSACNGGGCGLGTHMAGENLDEDSIVTQDSYYDLDAFVIGLVLVKAEVRNCILDSETELKLSSGGNSNGFLGNTADYTAQYEYTTSFRFETSPNVEL